jgi:hypothetical protein
MRRTNNFYPARKERVFGYLKYVTNITESEQFCFFLRDVK